MSIKISNNVYHIIGFDKENKVIQLLDEDGNDNNYIRKGGIIIWEEYPPTCNKCKKANITNQFCTDKCYTFNAIRSNETNKIIRNYDAKKKEINEKIKAELELIKDMKKNNIDYMSPLFSSFRSEDNTERMVFPT
jgi:hypothetical protein